jgi:Tol biopolymer transport system component
LGNFRDSDGLMRLRLYRGDGRGPEEYVPSVKGSGHPSFSPDGRLICTDGAGPHGNRVILCDPLTGRATVVADPKAVGAAYRTFKAIDQRGTDETVIDAVMKGAETWLTQAHVSWSRDGSAILFNSDLGQGSQLYAIDVERSLAGE